MCRPLSRGLRVPDASSSFLSDQTGADNLVCLKRPRDGELGSTIGKIKAKLFKHIDKKTYRKVMKECREAQAAAEVLIESPLSFFVVRARLFAPHAI